MLERLPAWTGKPQRRGSAAPAMFLLRPERYEADFLTEHAEMLDGVVLLGRHLAPPAAGSREHEQGMRGDELAQRVRAAGISHLHDPDTAVLTLIDPAKPSPVFGAAPRMRVATNLALPLAHGYLAGEQQLEDLVIDVLSSQGGAVMLAPPYFRFTDPRDPWLEVNLRAAELTQRIMHDHATAVHVEVDLIALRSGVLAQAAVMYADALGARGIALLKVAGLDTERAEPGDLTAYLHAVTAWANHGFHVVADRVGRFGAVAVAAGAVAACMGTRAYRTLPALEPGSPRLRSPKLCYWPAGRGDRLRPDVARERVARGTLDPCPHDDCRALQPGAETDETRLHAIHTTADELLLARQDPAGLAARMSTSPIAATRGWGHALAEAIRASEAA